MKKVSRQNNPFRLQIVNGEWSMVNGTDSPFTIDHSRLTIHYYLRPMIDNYYIADQFALLSKLMDIHAENSFKSKSYSIAAFNIEKLSVQL